MSSLKSRKKFILIIFAVIIIVGVFIAIRHHRPYRSTGTPITTHTNPTSQNPTGFNKQQYSISDPTSPWVIVNKMRSLSPIDYIPSNLIVPSVPLRLDRSSPEMQMRSDAAKALGSMVEAAKADGINLNLQSAYRSYMLQRTLYNSYVSSLGQATADRQSARPGHSEHQTGLAVDVGTLSGKCELQQCFGTLVEGKWVAANAYKYGFIIRYQLGKESITGYEYEPWHLRYLGTPLATEVQTAGVTLEEYFNLPAAPAYS